MELPRDFLALTINMAGLKATNGILLASIQNGQDQKIPCATAGFQGLWQRGSEENVHLLQSTREKGVDGDR